VTKKYNPLELITRNNVTNVKEFDNGEFKKVRGEDTTLTFNQN